jgi:hypothetical protein
MGLDDNYVLPERYNRAYHVCGDGVCVPVVRYIAEHILEPVLLNRDTSELIAAERSVAIDLLFRRRAVRTLSNEICCYLLCDLDQVPIYIGQSVDGIRSREPPFDLA